MSENKFIQKDGYYFKKSSRKDKKYDVYDDNGFITSFGHPQYQQYRDHLKMYKHLDHNDNKRRVNFHKRFNTKNGVQKNTALYFSSKYLW